MRYRGRVNGLGLDHGGLAVVAGRGACGRSSMLVVLIAVYGDRRGAGTKPTAAGPSARVAVTILAINDFHGHLRPPPGGISIADPADKTKRIAVPAGGAEHMATLVKELRAKRKHSVFVAAGDLIGASPLLSGLFHDEPTIEALSLMGLEVSAVGNHEFDEGRDELLRMQNGGCHPLAGCRGPSKFAGAKFRYLAASTIDRRTGKTLLPAYEVKEFEGIPVAFIGLTLKDTPKVVSPSGVAGLEFRDEAETVNAPGARAQAARHRGHRRADSRRRVPDRRLQRVSGHLGPHRRYREEARQGGRSGRQRPHPSRLQVRDRWAARHQRRQVRHAGDGDRAGARRPDARCRQRRGRQPDRAHQRLCQGARSRRR